MNDDEFAQGYALGLHDGRLAGIAWGFALGIAAWPVMFCTVLFVQWLRTLIEAWS